MYHLNHSTLFHGNNFSSSVQGGPHGPSLMGNLQFNNTAPTFAASVPPPSFSLGVNTNLPQLSPQIMASAGLPALPMGHTGLQTPVMVSSPAAALINSSILDITPKSPGVGMLVSTAKQFGKNELISELLPTDKMDSLKHLKLVGTTVSAVVTGKKLAEDIQHALDAGQPPAEAYACQTAKTLASAAVGAAAGASLARATAGYTAAAVSYPPVAASLPFVAPLVPMAFSGAKVAAEISGNVAEAACHSGFDYARQLSHGGKK